MNGLEPDCARVRPEFNKLTPLYPQERLRLESDSGKLSPRVIDIVAPIVGTLYAASGPDAPPFVKVGDRVQAGSVLCIIEAMKLMNEIEAEVGGVVREILVKNEEPVEYGQALFRLEPL